jgi:hypothetical protein
MTYTVVNCGLGTNSVALIVEAYNRGFRPDLIPFANTGNERPETYAYQGVFNEWLRSVGFPEICELCWIRKDGSFISIEDVCLRDGSLPSKAYGLSGCTTKWKQQPIDKFVYHLPPVIGAWGRGQHIERWIGFDADEPSRAGRMLDKNPQPTGPVKGAVVWRAPLVEWDMGRDECVAVIAAAGLPLPGKSSCFFCPSMKKHEIVQLGKTHPDLLARAVRLEDNARPNLTSVKGLGRSFSWRELIDGEKEASAACEVVSPDCGCYDGD